MLFYGRGWRASLVDAKVIRIVDVDSDDNLLLCNIIIKLKWVKVNSLGQIVKVKITTSMGGKTTTC